MEVVESNFDNRAWTVIRDGNTPSERLIMEAGFEKIDDHPVPGWDGYSLYRFDGNQAPA
jgi:hypothetical protein